MHTQRTTEGTTRQRRSPGRSRERTRTARRAPVCAAASPASASSRNAAVGSTVTSVSGGSGRGGVGRRRRGGGRGARRDRRARRQHPRQVVLAHQRVVLVRTAARPSVASSTCARHPPEQQPDLERRLPGASAAPPVYGLFRPRPSAAVVPAAAYATSVSSARRSSLRSPKLPPLTVRVAACAASPARAGCYGTRRGAPAAATLPPSTPAGRPASPSRSARRRRARDARRGSSWSAARRNQRTASP